MKISPITKMECPPSRNVRARLPFDQLRVGDSFEVSYDKEMGNLEKAMSSRIRYWQKRLNIKLRLRVTEKKERRATSVRIYRIKDDKVDLKQFKEIAKFGTENFSAAPLLKLIREVDGWLDVLNQVIPPDGQTEDLWEFMAEEGANLKIYDIPRRFHTDRVLSAWVSCDLSRIQDIPKESWTSTLKGRVHRQVNEFIEVADTMDELTDLYQAIAKIREERGLRDGEALIHSPHPIL